MENTNIYTNETLTINELKERKQIVGSISFRPSIDDDGKMQFFRCEDKTLRLDENQCPIPRYKMCAITKYSDGIPVFIGDIEWAVAKLFYQNKVIGKMEGSTWLGDTKIEVKFRSDKTCQFRTDVGAIDVPLPVLRASRPDAIDSGL